MAWTEQQQNAISSRNKNLLVSAAAGSGKTSVLVERITSLAIDDDCDVDKMLILTFTNAAAQEMKTRIHKKFLTRKETEKNLITLAKLERQSVLLSGSYITTFHSFCLSVLKKHFAKIDLDPKFREGNEQELKILQQEVLEKLFEEKYKLDDENFNKFTDEFGGNMQGDSDVYQMILNLYDFAQSRPYPEKWLNSLIERYENAESYKLKNDEIFQEFVIKSAEEEVQNIIGGMYEEIFHAKKTAASQDIFDKNVAKNCAKIVALLEDELKIFSDLKNSAKDWNLLRDKLAEEIKFASMPRFTFSDDLQEIKQNVMDIRNEIKKKLDDLKKMVVLSKEEIFAEIKENAKSVRNLVEITLDFMKEFSAAKREKGIIDFDDMEHLALKIFNEDKNISKFYKNKFKIVMVDEYQDTNDVQEEIISKIVSENNFFAVGDVKQSIYRFRNAAPEIFLQKYKKYPETENCERIDLSKNFRSRMQVVDAVNFIFDKLMTEDAMEIEYNDDAKLNFGANYPEGKNIFDEKPEFIIISQDKNVANNQQDGEENLTNFEKEIQLISQKINKMLDDKKMVFDDDKKIYRQLTYKDVVILLRSAEGKATKAVDILAANKIPAYAEDKAGYFKAPEIQTMLNLLNVLDNLRQDIPLAAVMLSPIGGFSAEDLAKLRIDNRQDELFILVNVCAMNNDELGLKCLEFLKKINRWRELSRQVSVPELLNTIYRETGYYDYFDNAAGKIAQANLRVLIDRAAEFESTAFRGLSRFIQFIKKIRELGNDLAAARTLGENENVVRIMTVHKSKGLEFPVVFVADLGKRFNTQDLNDTVIANRSLGIGIYKAVESDTGIKRISTLARRVIERKNRAETLAEEMRILYVAFTRAKEKLILVGTCSNKKLDKNKNLPEKITTQKLQDAITPLDWLLMKMDENIFDIEIFDENKIKTSANQNEKNSETEEKNSDKIEKVESTPLENIPAKLSVTEVKRRINEEENFEVENLQKNLAEKNIYRRPNFIQKSSITGAEFGSLMHGVMQRLNLQEKLDAKNISKQIDEMIGREIFTVEQGEILKEKTFAIEKFFASKIGKKILSAKKIYRELPFSQYIDAGEIKVESFQKVAGEKIFIQGIIDLLFEDSAGNWILLDYKTDRNNTDEYFKAEYREQINFYVRAMEKLLHLKIREKYLYLLGAGRLIEID